MNSQAQLSAGTLQRIELVFAPQHRSLVAALLAEECGNNLPFLENADPVKLERWRFAALKLSGGDLTELRRAIRMAQQDWRDVLVAAGFGNEPKAHESWWPPR